MKNNLKIILDNEVLKRDSKKELSETQRPDPLIIAKKYNDEYISVIASLFAYGKASLILKFLQTLDFNLLENSNENEIKNALTDKYYRFQKSEDVIAIFIALKRLKEQNISLENIFLEGSNRCNSTENSLKILSAIDNLIAKIENIYNYSETQGYRFLLGKRPKLGKLTQNSAYKRWNMLFRWLVRKDNLDMGLWQKIDKKDLLIPLDTHTFNISRKIGLLERKTYDFKAVVELTNNLKKFDISDPIKYDFALYRIGQEQNLDTVMQKRNLK
jgi:uncharacterized protein (TIGR02757 family)